MRDRFSSHFKAFCATSFSTRPQEWLRAASGVVLAMLLVLSADLMLFGRSVALPLSGPVAASAFLLFMAPSSPFARPWSVFAGSLTATLVGVTVGLAGLDTMLAGALAGGLTVGSLAALRCLHPPGCALGLVAALGGPLLHDLHYMLLLPVGVNAALLIAAALLYNNLTGHTYPKTPSPRENIHHTRDPLPGERLSFTQADIGQALEDFGEYVDVVPEDLERLIRQTERYALRRTMGRICAADIMSCDLYHCSPRTSVRQALRALQHHHLRALPVVEKGSGRLIGIVTLSDLLRVARPGLPRLGRLGPAERVGDLMSAPVVSVTTETHMVELVSLLSDRGLHCLPVVDAEQCLVGIVTQTDLVAALYRHWIDQLSGSAQTA